MLYISYKGDQETHQFIGCVKIFFHYTEFRDFLRLFKLLFSAETLYQSLSSQGDVRMLPLLSNFSPFDNAATFVGSPVWPEAAP